MQDLTHPGINYLIKHVGCILRRLFHIALEDIKEGHRLSKTFRLIPVAVENFLRAEFDSMLWDLMVDAAKLMHVGLKPLYDTIDPSLPTFYALMGTQGDHGGEDDGEEPNADGLVKNMLANLLSSISGSGREAKAILKRESKERAKAKKGFLRDERTSMITDEETEEILQRAFQYLIALMEFSLTFFRFQVNSYLFKSFKDKMKKSFVHKGDDANWLELVVPDDSVVKRITVLQEEIKGLELSLNEVQRMYQKL